MKLKKYKNIYYYLWFIYGFLVLVGAIEVLSAGVNLGIRSGNFLKPGIEHIGFAFVGLGLIIVIIKSREKLVVWSYKFADIAMYITLGLIILTLAIGREANQARRSLTIPIIHQTINTFEIFKLVVVIYLAKILTHNRKHEEVFEKNIIKGLIVTLVGLGIIATQNLSTALIIGTVVVVMIVLAQLPKRIQDRLIKYGGIILFVGIISVFILKVGRFRTWSSRISKFITGSYEIMDQGYLTQAAVANTSIVHFGPGKSIFKYILPLSYTDYIYAITAEEMPIVALLIPFLYLLLFYYSIMIVIRQKKPFYMLVVAGYALMITIQAFVHIAVNLALFPETGQPLPFVSKGGSAIIMNSIMLGIIMAIHRISVSTRKSEMEPTVEEPEEFDISSSDFDSGSYNNNIEDFENPIIY